MLAYVLAVAIVLVAALIAFGIAALLHLSGAAYAIFVVVVLLLGIAAAVTVVVLFHRGRKQRDSGASGAESGASPELDLLLNDANRKLRTSQQGAKQLEALPLIFILGESGSGKTTTVMQSGLDPELLGGSASSGSEQPPTQLLNIWFTNGTTLIEVGSTVRENNNLLSRLVQRTRSKAYQSAFGSGAAARAVIVCVTADQIMTADGGASLLASARSTSAQLREMSRLLGFPIPVYTIVTKLDRVPHFDQYVRNLSDEETRQVLGITLPRTDTAVGRYSDQVSRTIASTLDGITYQLGEFRVEMLDRENDARNSPGVYEFPREFGKLRKNLNQYLVELCKPSQLSANPYLRGVYFVGVRARLVERAVSAPIASERVSPQDAGATQFLKISQGQPVAARAAAPPQMVSSRVPQWTFLPKLFPEVIFSDKSALASTRQSTPAKTFRRILYASLTFVLAFYLVMIVVSYVHNANLEGRVANAARALPSVNGTSNFHVSTIDLHALDELRQVIVQLDAYQKDGPPLSYRFGLYQGNKLDVRARQIFFEHFRPMLLTPAQNNIVSFMRGLPEAPATNSDFSSYTNAYNPLKAYLITTANPEKSQSKFLTPVLLQYWSNGHEVDSEQQQLASKQIDFYAEELLRKPPYAIGADSPPVEHTRSYLSRFLAETRIYQGMLTDADKTSASVDFNKQYPGSANFVVDPHLVRGAFTKGGFGFMQDALQHPERYAQGETWVLGAQSGASLNPSVVSKDLTAQYTSDFVKEWHAFLTSARVTGCGSLKEAPARLNALAGPASPLLALFFTVSRNTAVADQQIKATFQPTQVLVDPNALDRLIGPGNAPYMTALSQLAGAVDLASQNPAATTDPAAFAPVSQQVVMAGAAAQQAAQAFNVDQQAHTEATVLSLMQAPIQCVAKLAPSPGAPANGAGQKVCGAVAPLLAKFPISSNSQAQATLQEVDSVFAPETGAVWTNYNASLKPFLIPQGIQFGPNPAAPQPLNPRFAQYFNRIAHVSAELYPSGQKTASLNFSLRFLPGNGVNSATFVLDGQRIAAGSTSQQFRWSGPEAQRASLVYDNIEPLVFQGTWSIFQLVRTAQIARTGGGYRLDYQINTATTVAGHTIGGSTGATKTASFELSGPGADLLVGDGFSGLNCVGPVVK